MLCISPAVTVVVSVRAEVMYCYQCGYRSRWCVMVSLDIDLFAAVVGSWVLSPVLS